jgi:hypothetical protein
MPFVDHPSEPAVANFERVDAPCPMGVNLSAVAIALDDHALDGALEDATAATR